MMYRTIAEAGRALRAGKTTPLDLVNACLAQIERLEPQVRAWVTVDAAGARRAAARAAEELKSGNDRGPLHGIPIGIKDIVDVAGFATRAGAKITSTEPKANDAHIVTRLREAGAILLGKTVTTEFASFDPPPTRNPWNLEHTPGGSSSGSAAACAVDMCFAAIGSQTGGSIIRPASYCGVYGLKPTWGRVSLEGITPLAMHLDHPGPIARCVDDLAIVYQAIAGFDENDPCSNRRSTDDGPSSMGREKPKLGVLKGFFRDKATDDVRGACDAAIEQLRQAGAVVETFGLPESFAGVVAAHRMVMAVEAAAYHRENIAARRSEYGPRVASLIDEGLAASSTDYARALALQLRFRRDMERLFAASKVDALAMPAVSNTAPLADTTGEPSFQAPWSFAGLPVVSMPCGLGQGDLPICLQFVGPAWRETTLLEVAAWCERAIGFTARPPLV